MAQSQFHPFPEEAAYGGQESRAGLDADVLGRGLAKLTTASYSYVPWELHQPRGKHPWCANCDTDLHLVVEFPAVKGRRAGSLAAAVHCSQCCVSRVLDTTADHLAALPTRSAAIAANSPGSKA